MRDKRSAQVYVICCRKQQNKEALTRKLRWFQIHNNLLGLEARGKKNNWGNYQKDKMFYMKVRNRRVPSALTGAQLLSWSAWKP